MLEVPTNPLELGKTNKKGEGGGGGDEEAILIAFRSEQTADRKFDSKF